MAGLEASLQAESGTASGVEHGELKAPGSKAVEQDDDDEDEEGEEADRQEQGDAPPAKRAKT